MASLLRPSLTGIFLMASFVSAQTPLFLKTRRIATDPSATVTRIVPSGSGRVHYLVQFSAPLTDKCVKALTSRGIRVLGDVPTNGLLVAVSSPVDVSDLGVSYAQP